VRTTNRELFISRSLLFSMRRSLSINNKRVSSVRQWKIIEKR
jgi:hypothetical protein